MSKFIPRQDYVTSFVQGAISDISTYSVISASANAVSTPLLDEITISNFHASVDSIVTIISGATPIYKIGAPRLTTETHKFEGGLAGVTGSSLAISAGTAATLHVSMRAHRE